MPVEITYPGVYVEEIAGGVKAISGVPTSTGAFLGRAEKEPLWANIRSNVGAFMMNLFRQGAFQGNKPEHAFFIKCGRETTTQEDIDAGVLNIEIGFAPLKPAEFVIINIRQIAKRERKKKRQ